MAWEMAIGAGLGALGGAFGSSKAKKRAREAWARAQRLAGNIRSAGNEYYDWAQGASRKWHPNAVWGGRYGEMAGRQLGLPGRANAGWADIARQQSTLQNEHAGDLEGVWDRFQGRVMDAERGDIGTSPEYRAQMRGVRDAMGAGYGAGGGFLSGARLAAAGRAGAGVAGDVWNTLYNRRMQEAHTLANSRTNNLNAQLGSQMGALNSLQQPYATLLGNQQQVQNAGQTAKMQSAQQAAGLLMGASNNYANRMSSAAMMPFAGAAAGAGIGQAFSGFGSGGAQQPAGGGQLPTSGTNTAYSTTANAFNQNWSPRFNRQYTGVSF